MKLYSANVDYTLYQGNMKDTLLKLKKLLNGIDDEELKEMDLWINNEENVELIALDNNSISLITDISLLKINDKLW